MKSPIFRLLAATILGLSLLTTPSIAKEDDKEKKLTKREEKEAAAKKEKEAKPKDKPKISYIATFSTTPAPTDADASELKVSLNLGTDFTCEEVKLADGKLLANLYIAEGRLNRATVGKRVKEKPKFKLEKVEEDKEANEKREKELKEKEKADK